MELSHDGDRTGDIGAGRRGSPPSEPSRRWRSEITIDEPPAVPPTPGAATQIKNQRTTTLSDPANPLSLFSLVDQSLNPNDPNKTTWTKTYTTAAGKRIVTTSPEGREKTQVLDNLGREVKSSLGDHHPTRKSYDANGRLSAIYEGPDPNTADTRVTTISYKSTMNSQNGLMDTITDPLGRTVSFTHDAAGRIVSGTLPDSRTVSFTYDDNGNRTSITPPGRPATVACVSHFHRSGMARLRRRVPVLLRTIATVLLVVSLAVPCGATSSPMTCICDCYEGAPSDLLWKATNPNAVDKGNGEKVLDYSVRILLYPVVVVTETGAVLFVAVARAIAGSG